MAIVALIPYSVVLSTIDWKIEVVMIPICRLPCTLRMTSITGCRKLRSLVIRIIGLVIVILVTSIAGIGRVVIVSIMTTCALIRDSSMCSKQWIIIIVVWK